MSDGEVVWNAGCVRTCWVIAEQAMYRRAMREGEGEQRASGSDRRLPVLAAWPRTASTPWSAIRYTASAFMGKKWDYDVPIVEV